MISSGPLFFLLNEILFVNKFFCLAITSIEINNRSKLLKVLFYKYFGKSHKFYSHAPSPLWLYPFPNRQCCKIIKSIATQQLGSVCTFFCQAQAILFH